MASASVANLGHLARAGVETPGLGPFRPYDETLSLVTADDFVGLPQLVDELSHVRTLQVLWQPFIDA